MATKDDDLEQQLKDLTDQELELKTIGQKNGWKPKNKMERGVRRQVYERFYELRDAPSRLEAEADWAIADKEFRMFIPPDGSVDFDRRTVADVDDWRSKLQLPDAFSAIQTQMQETIERKSRPVLNPTEESDEPITEFGNAVLTYNMNNTNYDYEWFLAKLAAASRGTAFVKDYWRLDKRIVKDPYDVDEDGELKYRDKEIIDIDDDYTEWLPNEYLYIDEKALHINNAIDSVEREILNVNEFKRVYGRKPGFVNTDFVQPGGDTTTRSFFQMPKDINENDVEVLHYYNKAIDAYWVVANNICIHYGPIPYKHKELPYAVLYEYRVPGLFWGLGIPKVIHFLSEERATIRRMNMDRQKMNIHKMFLHNSAFGLDDEDVVIRPMGIISVDTNGQSIDNAIKPLEFGDVPASYFKTEEILQEDMRRGHGIDDRIVVSNQGTTATQAAIVKESSLKRLNMISIQAEMDTVIRVGRLKWSNIQFFYPVPRMEKIYDGDKESEEKTYRKISVEGKKFELVKNSDDAKPELRMNDVRGATALRLDKKMAKYLQGSFDISVDSSVYTPVSKALQQSKVTEVFSLVLSNPATLSVLDPEKAVARLLTVNEEKPDNWMKLKDGKTTADWQKLADAENMIMAAGQPLAPTEDATEEHTMEHLNYTKTVEFAGLPEEVQQIIMDHILGEHDANPATGMSSDLLAANGLSPGGQVPAGMATPEPMGLSAETSEPQNQVADLQPTNFAVPE
jgi:hypothetical protein